MKKLTAIVALGAILLAAASGTGPGAWGRRRGAGARRLRGLQRAVPAVCAAQRRRGRAGPGRVHDTDAGVRDAFAGLLHAPVLRAAGVRPVADQPRGRLSPLPLSALRGWCHGWL